MTNAFVIADPHFGHRGVCKFLRDDGTKLRPWDDPEAMDEAMVERWNKTVRPDDKVYVLGDLCINRKALQTVKRLNGKKHLVKGNHDIFKLHEYTELFYEISACRSFKDMVFTHIPIHPDSVGRWGTNVHGHIHAHRVLKEPDEFSWPVDGETHVIRHVVDPRYFCVSAEQIDYTPLHIDILRERIAEQQKLYS